MEACGKLGRLWSSLVLARDENLIGKKDYGELEALRDHATRLTWPDRLERRKPYRLFPHPLEKLTGQIEADVRFQQDSTDLAESLRDCFFGEDTTAGQLAQGGIELG